MAKQVTIRPFYVYTLVVFPWVVGVIYIFSSIIRFLVGVLGA